MRLPSPFAMALIVTLVTGCAAAAPLASTSPTAPVAVPATPSQAPSPSPSPSSSVLVLHVLADFRSNKNLAQGGSLQWTPKTMDAPADQPFQIAMKVPNDTAHNLWIEDATGTAIFKGGDGVHGTTTYDIPSLAAGTYAFVCTYHRAAMTGTLTIH
jgi:plastocyanin